MIQQFCIFCVCVCFCGFSTWLSVPAIFLFTRWWSGVRDVHERKGFWPDEDLLIQKAALNQMIQYDNKEANMFDNLADNHELCVVLVAKNRGFDSCETTLRRQPQYWCFTERFFFWHRDRNVESKQFDLSVCWRGNGANQTTQSSAQTSNVLLNYKSAEG